MVHRLGTEIKDAREWHLSGIQYSTSPVQAPKISIGAACVWGYLLYLLASSYRCCSQSAIKNLQLFLMDFHELFFLPWIRTVNAKTTDFLTGKIRSAWMVTGTS